MKVRLGANEERRRLKAMAISAARDATREFRAVIDSIEQRLEALEDATEEAHGTALLALQALATDRREMLVLLEALDGARETA